MKRKGFTLIELLAVIGIIGILIAVLIPAVSSARSNAKRTGTEVQLRNIALACDSYYGMFNAYPGFIAETSWATAGYRSAGSNSQWLVTSLAGRFFDTDPSAAPYSLATAVTGTVFQAGPNATDVYVATNPTLSPRNYAVNTNGTPRGRDYGAFLTLKPSDLSTGVLPGLRAPVLVDSTYGSDALPVLYYRQHVKFDPISHGVNGWIQDDSGVAMSSFYMGSNSHLSLSELTAAGEETGASQTFIDSQSDRLRHGQTQAVQRATMAPMLTHSVGNKIAPRGTYVLISAGPDRIYGNDEKGNCDDVIVSGGN